MVVFDASEVKPDTTAKINNCEDLKKELNGFIGTLNYYRHFTGLGHFTDGVKFLADRVGAYWLIDAIFSWQVERRSFTFRGERRAKVGDAPFQVWTLKVASDKTAVLEMREDSDQPPVVRQEIEFTDFPQGEVKLYLIDGVLLLPSEY